MRKSTNVKQLPQFLIPCVQRADFHLMQAERLYYSYSQSWIHSLKGYLIHGPYLQGSTCLDIWKCTDFKRLSHYLTRCVQRADIHLMENYGLYYSYSSSWIHGSKSYLFHGPYLQRCTWQVCENALRSSDYQTTSPTASRGLISILWKPMVCTNHTSNIGPIAQRANWYMGHTSHDTLVQI